MKMKNLMNCCTIFDSLSVPVQNLLVELSKGGDLRRLKLPEVTLPDLVAARDFMSTVTFKADYSHDLWREASYLFKILQAEVNRRKPNES